MTYNPDTSQGIAAAALTDSGALALTDLDVINRGGVDYRTTMTQRVALFRKTPAGSRAAVLPAALTAADHDKNIVLTGGTGALSVDGTVSDGFRCHVVNAASGAATYTGITGLLGTTSLASGSVCTVLMAGTTVYATAVAGVSVPIATAYTIALAASSGNVGSPVTIILTPTAGAWPNGTSIALAAAGVSGTFSANPLTPSANSVTALTATFTPSSAGAATITPTATPAMANTTGSLTYTAAIVPAVSYSMTAAASSGFVGSPVTLTFAPSGGVWPPGSSITPASSLAGTFSPLALASGAATAATCTFTPSTAGAATISATNNASLTNPASLSYAAVVAATAYTVSLSASAGPIGTPVTLTLTPTAGAWPAGEAITPKAAGVTGTFSPATISAPGTSSSGVTCSFTPSSAGTATLSFATTPALNNTTGNLAFTATLPTATAYTTSLSASAGAVRVPLTVTFTPTSGAWPAGETITPTVSSLTGAFSPATLSPAAGTTTPVTSTFTSTAPGTGTIGSSSSPAMTSSTAALTYTATGIAPPYPSITTAGASALAIYDANTGVTTSGGYVTGLADQSGNGNNLIAASGVTVGPAVNGFPGLQFGGTSITANSGLRSSGSWLANMTRDMTIAIAFRTGSSIPNGMTIFDFEPATANYSDDLFLWVTSGSIALWKRASGWGANNPGIVAAPAANTLYKILVRFNPDAGSGSALDYWVNGGPKNSVAGLAFGTQTNAYTTFALGQAATGAAQANYGMTGMTATGGEVLEMHCIQGDLSDSDVAKYQAYLTSKWGS